MACFSVVFIICLIGICLSDFSEAVGINDLEWIKQPQHSAAVPGQDLIIDCQVRFIDVAQSSSHNILYLWMLEGKPVDSKTSIFSNHSLLVPQVNSDDVGIYTCLVSLATSDGRVVETTTASATVIEAYIEPFVIEPQSQVLKQGDQVVLTCVTGRSAPSLEVYWMRNGQKFVDGDKQTASFGDSDVLGLSRQMSMRLEIIASHSTTGKYQCVAINSDLGTQMLSREANVTLDLSPSDLLPEIDWDLPEQLFIAEGQELVLSCKSQVSTEPVRTDWFIGRYLVDESKRVYVLPNSSLAFLPLASRDRGTYRCRLTNSIGSTWSPTVQLVIAYLDTQFKQEPSDTLALYGEDVVLDCQPPSSLPTAAVLWYKNFAVLDFTLRSTPTSIVNGSLLLTSVRSSDQGQYYCVAINEVTQPSTRTSRVALLTIQGPPEMTQPPVSTKLVRGTLLHLSCRAVSNPSPVISWSFEGKLLGDTDRISIIDNGQELWISNVGREWSGTFTCHCTNKYGSISANATVTIVVPPSSLRSIGELIVKSGDPLTIVCPIVGVPQPAIQWFHNGSEVLNAQPSDIAINDNTVSMSIDSVNLFVDHVTPDHTGVYMCKGTNEAGVAMSTGQVIVYVLPYFTKGPENTAVIEEHSLNLNCEAGGNPVPSIQWKFNDSYSSVQGTFSADNTSLTISHFKWQHVGSYTCVASNNVGQISNSASVKILIPPNITRVTHPESAVRIGRSFQLSCQVEGIPPPAISWNHQGVSVSQSLDGRVRLPAKNVLEIESAQLSDSGQYECQATSEAGVDKSVVTVTVYGPPNPPNLQQALPLSSASVYLIWSWSSSGQAAQSLSGFKIVYRERINEELHVFPRELLPNARSLEVPGLQPATAYVFYMVAVNDAGESRPSNVLTAATLQAEPSSPTNLRAERVTAVSAMLVWEVPLSPNGEVKLYQLRFTRQDRPGEIQLVNISNVMIPTQEYQLDSLRPYFEYTAQVRAATVHLGTEMWGQYGPAFTFRTAMSDPSLSPQNIKTTVLDATSVSVSWEKIPEIVQNGPITHYHVRCVDSSDRTVAQTTTNSSVMSWTFHGLHPWRQYGILVQGENPHGKSPASDIVTFITFPIAPITVPRNFTGQSVSSTAILLSWEPLPADTLTCEISSYEVHLRIQGASTWNSISVPSNTTSYLTENLMEWTPYEFEIAAFTESVKPGIGPFTDLLAVKTKEGESGPVTGLHFVSMATSMSLTWRSPLDVKGILRGYSVVYSLKEFGKDNPGTRLNLSKEEFGVHLEKLVPSSLYNITVRAVNGAGDGEPSILLVRTDSHATTTAILETSTSEEPVAVETTAEALLQQQANSSHVKKNLAAIVAGSIVGSICLIIITVFFCLKCKQYRRKQRLSNVIDSEDFVREVRADSYSRTLSDPPSTTSSSSNPQDVTYEASSDKIHTNNSNTPSDTTSNGNNSAFVQVSTTTASTSATNIKGNEGAGARKYDSFDPDSALDIEDDQNKCVRERDNSAASQTSVKERSDGSHTSQLGALKKKLSHLPRLSGLSNRYSKFDGEESIASDMDGANDSFSDLPQTPKDLEGQQTDADTVSIMSDTLKKRTRMRSESAAAIAALRNSQGSTLDDTDVLVDKDIHAEVVFNERTVL